MRLKKKFDIVIFETISKFDNGVCWYIMSIATKCEWDIFNQIQIYILPNTARYGAKFTFSTPENVGPGWSYVMFSGC